MQSDVTMRQMSAKTVGYTLIMERDCANRLTGLTLFKHNQLLFILIMDERTQEKNSFQNEIALLPEKKWKGFCEH